MSRGAGRHGGLAGTAEAGVPCSFCSHAKIRHTKLGRGPCTHYDVTPVVYVDGTITPQITPCRCRYFVEQPPLPLGE